MIFHVENHPDFTDFSQCVSFHVLSPPAEVIKFNFTSEKESY